jgi:hypothetical protein
MGYQVHAPLDPDCPDNPVDQGFWDDPITVASGVGDEIAADLEAKHRRTCERCRNFGAANIEVVEA